MMDANNYSMENIAALLCVNLIAADLDCVGNKLVDWFPCMCLWNLSLEKEFSTKDSSCFRLHFFILPFLKGRQGPIKFTFSF